LRKVPGPTSRPPLIVFEPLKMTVPPAFAAIVAPGAWLIVMPLMNSSAPGPACMLPLLVLVA
jgi:hypothetical protein